MIWQEIYKTGVKKLKEHWRTLEALPDTVDFYKLQKKTDRENTSFENSVNLRMENTHTSLHSVKQDEKMSLRPTV